MGDAFRRAESGTQLLARLEGRSSLKNLEPNLFAEEGSPVHALGTTLRVEQYMIPTHRSFKCDITKTKGREILEMSLNSMVQKEQEKLKCFIT
ncbi:DNA repair protein XRCC2 isoform X2 [Lagopus muta]|uniref:DNA repair protein XRCC2 isoform X2 n=1 Tax=Lagopus muta TaxID=64668 RepID=UPI0020A0D5E4|nr:DNA repair protein XRCC2 isoform X2 [Lagopus muta]